MNSIRINREPKSSIARFKEVFEGFQNLPPVQEIFGQETERVLEKLSVEVRVVPGYTWVNDRNGNLCISSKYLKDGDSRSIYLDVIHELVHVKQYAEGRSLFDRRYPYVDRPTEIEAYEYTVKEAHRIGMSDEEILEYLSVEWLSETDLQKLAERLSLKHH